MAHCIYLEEDEVKMFQEKKVGIAHCPSSNFWYIINALIVYVTYLIFCVCDFSVFAVVFLMPEECLTWE